MTSKSLVTDIQNILRAARICPNCGDAYADETVAANLLREAESMARDGIKVDVRESI